MDKSTIWGQHDLAPLIENLVHLCPKLLSVENLFEFIFLSTLDSGINVGVRLLIFEKF